MTLLHVYTEATVGDGVTGVNYMKTCFGLPIYSFLIHDIRQIKNKPLSCRPGLNVVMFVLSGN